MKIYAVYLFRKSISQESNEASEMVDSAKDFSDVGFFYKKSVNEICDFTVKQLANSLNPIKQVTTEKNEFLFHVLRKDDVCSILIATKDYPSRAAYAILREIQNEYFIYNGSYPGGKSKSIAKAITVYQNPLHVDRLAQIQKNLDDTREIMILNMEKAIGREKSLEELCEKSQEISNQSKIFVRQSKDLNRCCSRV
ncbi:Synaptobrevin YKT6 [Tritrichomonas foetus]|uniref:Synaptobrevin YKT6 n=1 Tax=Tritrichomonas foetus TaxID=1144522 RepID=A0A1J4JV30_9EUKA|nr:Synaptobrevin YKT6 [Tritrichomonas foetus]|eukprot:OHT01380.1 Synaptobrevin YKT6 [Tritrichomonas foetus]